MGPLVFGRVLAARGRRVLSAMAAQWRLGMPGGLVSVPGYGIVLWARTRGALAALRETAVSSGAVIGAVFFRERMGLPRLAAALVVVAGVALINLS
jgi:drug/metabolite transporter (DMT)-like permease